MTRTTVIFVLLCLSQLPSTSRAQEESCQITKLAPVQMTSSGKDAKAAVQYQSAAGSNCRLYRVRNLPAHPSTPVQWKTTNEILLDAQLPECPYNTVCPWIMSTKAGPDVEKGYSTVVYGKRDDSHSDTAEVFVKKKGASEKVPEYRTSLQATLKSAEGKPTAIGIEVASKVEGTGPYQLSYRLSLLGCTPEPAGRARETIECATQLGIWSPIARKMEAEGLTVDWQGITQRFHARPGLATLVISQDSPEATVRVPAKGIRLVPVSLVLRAATQRVATTTAPAYLPVE